MDEEYDQEYKEIWAARDQGYYELTTHARGLIFDIEQTADRLLELSQEVRGMALEAIERVPGEPVRPAVTDPEALEAAAGNLLAASKVALAHAGAWQLYVDDTKAMIDELCGWEQTPSWAKGRKP